MTKYENKIYNLPFRISISIYLFAARERLGLCKSFHSFFSVFIFFVHFYFHLYVFRLRKYNKRKWQEPVKTKVKLYIQTQCMIIEC